MALSHRRVEPIRHAIGPRLVPYSSSACYCLLPRQSPHSSCLARRSPAVQPILPDFARLNRTFRRAKLTTHRSPVHRPMHPHLMTGGSIPVAMRPREPEFHGALALAVGSIQLPTDQRNLIITPRVSPGYLICLHRTRLS